VVVDGVDLLFHSRRHPSYPQPPLPSLKRLSYALKRLQKSWEHCTVLLTRCQLCANAPSPLGVSISLSAFS
jgi:hypothetical protein